MKKCLIILCFMNMGFMVQCQTAEIEQLLLNFEKLMQFKKILQNMYEGYTILEKGYNNIRNISEGNFSLHKVFLDGLLEVSPVVKKYQRIEDIIHYQQRIVREYKAAFNQFRGDKNFTRAELDYMQKLYSRLFHQSVQSLDALFMVITSGELRMSDEERLEAIDHIYSEVVARYNFLHDFNNSTKLLSVQRTNATKEIGISGKLNGLP